MVHTAVFCGRLECYKKAVENLLKIVRELKQVSGDTVVVYIDIFGEFMYSVDDFVDKLDFVNSIAAVTTREVRNMRGIDAIVVLNQDFVEEYSTKWFKDLLCKLKAVNPITLPEAHVLKLLFDILVLKIEEIFAKNAPEIAAKIIADTFFNFVSEDTL